MKDFRETLRHKKLHQLKTMLRYRQQKLLAIAQRYGTFKQQAQLEEQITILKSVIRSKEQKR